MRNYCTYFDSFYVDKGIALYLSLLKQDSNFQLFVMAFDDGTYNKLIELSLKNIIVERLSDFETPELLAIKSERVKPEYCWTCGPSIIEYFLLKYNLADIAYLDSDLFFVSSPKVIFDEIGEKSVAITEHFTPVEEMSGKYCVQFMYFKNNQEGLKVLRWWKNSCIDWCYARFENGKYADQKYLEYFSHLYTDTCVIKNRGVGVAPWNCLQYKYSKNELIFFDKRYEIVFFHEHGISFEPEGLKLNVRYRHRFNYTVKEVLFRPYAELMMDVFNNYLGISISLYRFKQPSWIIGCYQKVRSTLKHSRIVRFVYYHLLMVKTNSPNITDVKKC